MPRVTVQLLDRYILKELGPPFLLSLCLFTGLLFMNHLLRVVDLLISRGAAIGGVLHILVLIIPAFLVITIPVAVLVAVTTAFSRLAADREWLALQAAGVHPLRLLVPVGGFGVAAWIVTMIMAIYAQPFGGIFLRQVEAAAARLMMQRVELGVEPGILTVFPNKVVIYASTKPSPTELEGVVVADERQPDRLAVIVAKRGQFLSRPDQGFVALRLADGTLYLHGPNPDVTHHLSFSTYELRMDLLRLFPTLLATPKMLSPDDIRVRLAAADGREIQWRRQLQDYYKQYAIPIAALIFALLGAPLGRMAGVTGRMGGFSIGLGVVVLYYLLGLAGDLLVVADLLPPLPAAHLPNLVLGTGMLGLMVWWRGG